MIAPESIARVNAGVSNSQTYWSFRALNFGDTHLIDQIYIWIDLITNLHTTMSNTSTHRNVVVVGAGPIGCLAAMAFAKRGWCVDLYESRSGQ